MSKKLEFCEPNDVPFTIRNIGHYRIDWEKIRSCTKEQKQNLVPFIENLIHFEKNILAGQLTLSGLISYFDDIFEKYAISLLMEGWKYEILSDILYNFVSASDLSPEIYLEYAIFIRYILEEKLGHHDINTLYHVLLSYLGFDCMKPSVLPKWFEETVKE